ncbi:MAG: alpha/beta hydrolase [Myxococcota bacterium]|nr:alpha/beta hydrolase [Myxococcota bacterium]
MPPSSDTGPTLGGALYSLRLLVTPPAFEPAAPTEGDVPYREAPCGPGTAPQGDVYLPEGSGPHPSVILVHGGGFLVGSRRMKPARYLATRLVEAGYAVFVPSYRQILRGGRLPEMVDDARTAILWWLASDERYNLDLSRTILCGKSAGACIAMLAAEEIPEGSIHHFVSIFGLYDLRETRGVLGRLLPRFLLRSNDAEELIARSPIARGPLPLPMTLLHGTEDLLVPHQQAEDLVALRQAAELETHLLSYEGEGHSFFSDANRPICEEAMKDLLEAIAPKTQ